MTIPADGGGHLAYDHIGATSEALTDLRGRPCVVMAHGLGATRDCGLDGFVAALTAAGADVLRFDYRHFAESSGMPRQLVSLRGQHRDYHSAVRFARSLPGVDPERIILWGASLSGGHVLQVGAQDPRVVGVISVTPAVSGLAASMQMLRARGVRDVSRLMRYAVADGVAALRGRPPVLAPLAGEPGEPAALASPGALEAMLAIAGPTWRNEFAARLLLSIAAFRPGTHAHLIRGAVLMQIADDDQLAPADAAARVAARAKAMTHHYPCDHFDVYTGAAFHDAIAQHQVQFVRGIAAPVREEAQP